MATRRCSACLLGLFILGVCLCVILVGGVTFRGLPAKDLALASLAIPFLLAVANIQSVYQGFRDFKEYNRITLAQAALPFAAHRHRNRPRRRRQRRNPRDRRRCNCPLRRRTGQRATVEPRITWRTKLPNLRALFSYGLRVHPANVLGYLGYRLDVFLVNGYKGAAAVGLYGAGVVIAEGLWMPSQAISTALFPTIAAENSESARRAITPFVARSTLWLTAISTGGFSSSWRAPQWSSSTPVVSVLPPESCRSWFLGSCSSPPPACSATTWQPGAGRSVNSKWPARASPAISR